MWLLPASLFKMPRHEPLHLCTSCIWHRAWHIQPNLATSAQRRNEPAPPHPSVRDYPFHGPWDSLLPGGPALRPHPAQLLAGELQDKSNRAPCSHDSLQISALQRGPWPASLHSCPHLNPHSKEEKMCLLRPPSVSYLCLSLWPGLGPFHSAPI